MYQVSNEYINQIASGIISDKELFGTLTLIDGEVINLTNKDFANSSVKIDNACDNGSDICLGSAYTGKLSLGLFSSIDRYRVNKADGGAVIELSYKLGEQEIPLGVFNVYECTRTGIKLSISAYDNMSKLNKSLGSNNVSGAAWAVLSWIAKKCDVEIANSKEEISAFINADVICNISGDNFSTYQDVLSELCELMGCFAIANRVGKIELKKFGTESVFNITPKMRKNTKPSDFDVYYTELVETDVNKVKWTAITGDGSGLTYKIDNVFVTGTEAVKQKIVQNIMNVLEDIYYTPCDLGIMYNPIFDLGDVVTIEADGIIVKENIDILITSFVYTFNGSSTLSSVGSNRLLLSKIEKESTSESSSYNALKYNGTYIAVYEGISEYSIGNSEKIVSSIDYSIGTSNKVSLAGAAQIDVTTAGTIEIKYYVNDELDIFSTKQYLDVGSHTLNFSNWFDVTEDMQNMYNNFSIGLVSTDLVGKIAVQKIKTYILASSSSNGLWKSNNVFEEEIDFRRYTDNSSLVGWEVEEDEK
jgi:hypothetical protein